jgi:hypothetical protein
LGDDNCSTSSLVDSIGGPKVGIEKCLTWITTKKKGVDMLVDYIEGNILL